MPRGLSGPIKDELNSVIFNAPIYCVRITRTDGEVLRWGEQRAEFDDGTGVKTYEARLISISGLAFAPDEAGTIEVIVSNIDGLITTLDRLKSFDGSQFEILAFLPNAAAFYIVWSGWSDDVTSINQEIATFKAYPTTLTPNVQVPKRVLGMPCTNTFGNFANWNSTIDFEGSECPYQRGNPIDITIGFFALLPGDIQPSDVGITIQWPLNPGSNGAKFKKGDVIRIEAELILITNDPGELDGGGGQSLIVTRGYRQTTATGHSVSTPVYFANCFFSEADCIRHGMFGNNPTDVYGTKKRNYFAGFPFLTGYQYGTYRTKVGERTQPLRLVFSGNESAYGRAIPIVYGRARVADPILLIAKPEGDFLTTLWVVSEGVLGTNAVDESQTTPVNAYSQTIGADGLVDYKIYVNGIGRHDRTPGFGIEAANGDQDRSEPIANFFPTDPAEFINNNFGFWGSARVTFRISKKDNPSVDVTGQSITGSMEVQYGRIHRVYSDVDNYVRRATDDGIASGANPAFVLLDLLASKRAGGGLDYGRFNIQSFVDVAQYCSGLVTNVFGDGTSVKRWTFNGVIDQRKQLQEWLHFVCLGMYCLPPYMDKDGKLKIRALKAESIADVPVFSSKVADVGGRNIIWINNHSSLSKSRRSISEVPNELRVNYIDKSYDPGFTAELRTQMLVTTLNITIRWGASGIAAGMKFSKDDKIVIGTETMWITNSPALPDVNRQQNLTVRRGYAGTTPAGHLVGSIIQFIGRSYNKISIVIADRDSQTAFGEILGDQSLRALQKSVDLPGVTTADEAARIGTLILRAGEFGQGGLANNLKITFSAAYRDAEDLEIGDIIEVEDDLLEPALNERYFRVLRITPQPVQLTDGGFVFTKEIEAVQHDNAIYDDTALTVSDFTHVDAAGASDGPPPAVTAFAIAESGIIDANGRPATQLFITFNLPDPVGNWRSLVLYRSNDDGADHPVGDWRFVGEVVASGTFLTDQVTGKLEWYCAVSRALSGHLGNIDALRPDGGFVYPRVQVLVDGTTDAPLAAPTGLQAFGRGSSIYLTWNAYTGTQAQVFKRFNVYRSPVNIPEEAVQIAQTNSNWFVDESEEVTLSPSTVFYYWVRGVSWIENVDINGVTQTGLSPFSLEAHDYAGSQDTNAQRYLVNGIQVVGAQQGAIATVTGTAGGTYTGSEQTLINDLKTAVNLILGAARTHGLIATVGGPGTSVQPFNQKDWPLPPTGKFYPPDLRTYTREVDQYLIGKDKFFTAAGESPRYDWPNPKGATYPSDLRTFTRDISRMLLGKDKFFTVPGQGPRYDWPNPRGPLYPLENRTFINPIELALIGKDKFFDAPGQPPTYDWPNPKRSRRMLQDWNRPKT